MLPPLPTINPGNGNQEKALTTEETDDCTQPNYQEDCVTGDTELLRFKQKC